MPLTLRLRTARDDSPVIAEAADIVRNGGLVVFPTETVYGLGAGLNLPEAAARVRALKRRPVEMPLLVHVATIEALSRLARTVPAFAFPLFEAFLPGPLAVILTASDEVPLPLRGPDETIGIRVVNHPVTRVLLRRTGMPLVGSSANLHGAPATGDFSELEPVIAAGADVVIDAGRCGSGVASTVIDLTVDPPRLVREGAVSRKQIATMLGRETALLRGNPPES